MKSRYSECRNKALAAAFAYMNLIENWGSGVKRYIREVKEAGLREPEFIEWPNAMRVNVYRTKTDKAGKGEGKGESLDTSVVNGVGKDVVKSVGKDVVKSVVKGVVKEDDNLERIVKHVVDNPRATRHELAKVVGLSIRGIERDLKVLKLAGRIRRVGGKKYGYWEVCS